MSDECKCTAGKNVVVDVTDAPDEVKSLVELAAKIATDYPQAVAGVRTKATSARKNLMAIRKLALDMRKMALEKCNAAKEAGVK